MRKGLCCQSGVVVVLVLAVMVAVVVADRYKQQQQQQQQGKCTPTETDPDGDCIIGVSGQDYPSLAAVPSHLSFTCPPSLPGIFADVETACQVYHMCLADGTMHSFLCPNGTMFHQEYFVCDLWFNVDCERAPDFYSLNQYIYRDPEPKDNKYDK
ncbi:hypothetical protein Pmani_027493 [Petrolisthes manimaculis]|uniref:Chitin-binding type-2 domain-containing protein n=1 Tax=Petrolisthes manimaculis TaxID=1843537 RepID=A0AAE1P2L3_9EUCA|nr:hypothetical protein Pmani_027493 [Petrolisthes manimaculis]